MRNSHGTDISLNLPKFDQYVVYESEMFSVQAPPFCGLSLLGFTESDYLHGLQSNLIDHLVQINVLTYGA